jgi:hypothetical protein
MSLEQKKFFESGVMHERERIIQLVRQHSKESSNLHYEYWSALADVIRLIKEEQK